MDIYIFNFNSMNQMINQFGNDTCIKATALIILAVTGLIHKEGGLHKLVVLLILGLIIF